ncbi:MAG TPA: sulfatase-like hydrolase/transferase, partial [Candidatus Hydrogenedentes bacterium]|nr:sulfatase-like hydrolase/transferase [Candidatus Hydrogenedentota bacterium]
KGLKIFEPFDFFYNFFKERSSRLILKNEAYTKRVRGTLDRFNAPMTQFTSTLIVADAGDVVEVVASALGARPTGRPFFLFVNFMDAHDPYYPPSAFYNVNEEPLVYDFCSDLRMRPVPTFERLKKGIKDEDRLSELDKKYALVTRPWMIAADLRPSQMALYRARYKASIRFLDNQIGALHALLEDQGLYENSIFFVLADHGEAFGENDLLTHSLPPGYTPKEVTQRVPFILVPEIKDVQERIEIHDTVCINAVTPTLHEVLGIRYDTAVAEQDPHTEYGSSLMDMATDDEQVRRHFRPRETGLELMMRNDVCEDLEAPEAERIEALQTMGYIE